jgi:hypothetical protein
MSASLYSWLRSIAPRPSPSPFVGTGAGTKDVKVRVIPVVPVRVMPVPLGQQPIWHQEAETLRIDKMVEAGKAEWERDAAARRGHTQP